MQTRLPPARASGCCEIVSIGSISVRLHRPHEATEPTPALLWIHGGGYVMGHAAQEDGFCRRLAAELGILVVAVGYRLAPEHAFPVPLHDCHDALRWLADLEEVDRQRVAIGGASAGGGLAAALALLARDRDEVRPRYQLLTYPMLDDRTAARRDVEARHRRLWDNTANRFGWRSYLGAEPGGDISELAAPARATHLSELPPAWIGVGTLDLFAAEDLDYARRLQAVRVPCDVHVVPGAFHGFDVIHPRARVSREFRAAQIAALGHGLGILA